MSILIRKIVRGNIITVTATFLDAAGDQTTPSSATLTVDYLADTSDGNARTSEEIAMDEQTSGQWMGEWDSSVAQPGSVYGSVKAEGPSAAQDFEIRLTANLANLVEA